MVSWGKEWSAFSYAIQQSATNLSLSTRAAATAALGLCGKPLSMLLVLIVQLLAVVHSTSLVCSWYCQPDHCLRQHCDVRYRL